MKAYGGQSWAIETFADLTTQLQGLKDEFGLHFHAYRNAPEDGGWIQDFADGEWLREAISAAISVYSKSFGRPRYFRIGDGWISNEVVAQLEQAGVEYDLTLEPGPRGLRVVPPDRGAFPDLRQAPRVPYRPSRDDFRVPGDDSQARNLWMVPVTTTCLYHPGRWHGASPWNRTEALNLGAPSDFVLPFIDRLLEQEPPLIVAVARTGDLSATPLSRNLDYLLGHPAIERLTFETPASALERFLLNQRVA